MAVTVSPPGGRLRIYNLHLDTRLNLSERLVQLEPVMTAARKWEGSPVVIGGDFNTSPFRWLVSVVPWFRSDQAGAIDDHMKEKGFSAPLADSGATLNRRFSKFRLDSIYLRGLDVLRHGVEREVRSSDHYPIWVEVTWPPEGATTESPAAPASEPSPVPGIATDPQTPASP